MATTASLDDSRRWWGEHSLPQGEWHRWRIGSLTLWIKRLESEWRLAWLEEEGEEDRPDLPEVNRPAPDGPPEAATLERVVSRHLGERLIVSPRLADRCVVTRPETRFRLAAHGEVELYVGTLLWMHLATVEPDQELLDIPTRRPSDTWFGPSTTDGELCYASRTAARLRRDHLLTVPHRAVTLVRLRNQADDDLLLERLNLPVPNLALFADARGDLWTQSVSVERGSDGELAEVRIEADPPAAAAGAERLAEPRGAVARNVFSRALGALLG